MNTLKGNIPQSTIKGSGFVNTDLDSKNNGEKLLFTHPDCVVIGIDDLPYMLFLTPEFDERNLPAMVNEKIYEVKKIVLKSTYSDEMIKRKRYYSIPKWLKNFKKVESIDFENANLDDLELLKECPVKCFIFHDVKFENLEKLTSAMRLFKNLKNVSCSSSFSSHFKHVFQELNINEHSLSDENQI